MLSLLQVISGCPAAVIWLTRSASGPVRVPGLRAQGQALPSHFLPSLPEVTVCDSDFQPLPAWGQSLQPSSRQTIRSACPGPCHRALGFRVPRFLILSTPCTHTTCTRTPCARTHICTHICTTCTHTRTTHTCTVDPQAPGLSRVGVRWTPAPPDWSPLSWGACPDAASGTARRAGWRWVACWEWHAHRGQLGPFRPRVLCAMVSCAIRLHKMPSAGELGGASCWSESVPGIFLFPSGHSAVTAGTKHFGPTQGHPGSPPWPHAHSTRSGHFCAPLRCPSVWRAPACSVLGAWSSFPESILPFSSLVPARAVAAGLLCARARAAGRTHQAPACPRAPGQGSPQTSERQDSGPESSGAWG